MPGVQKPHCRPCISSALLHSESARPWRSPRLWYRHLALAHRIYQAGAYRTPSSTRAARRPRASQPTCVPGRPHATRAHRPTLWTCAVNGEVHRALVAPRRRLCDSARECGLTRNAFRCEHGSAAPTVLLYGRPGTLLPVICGASLRYGITTIAGIAKGGALRCCSVTLHVRCMACNAVFCTPGIVSRAGLA